MQLPGQGGNGVSMIPKTFSVKDLTYTIRPAVRTDGKALSEIRVIIDGETENMDRESGEDFLSAADFAAIAAADAEDSKSLFLVAETGGRLAGFLRVKGNHLKRTSHRAEFGVAVLKEFWGFSIGRTLIEEMIHWADTNEIRKLTLQVLETNDKAISLYERLGFEKEGCLKDDKRLNSGYYDTILMGRIRPE